MVSRRAFTKGLATIAFAGLVRSPLGSAHPYTRLTSSKGYGELVSDPEGLLDLPQHFTYRVISVMGEPMSDGLHVPDKADGMGCFPLDSDRLVLIRNHELQPKDLTTQPKSIQQHRSELAYDTLDNGVALPAGTTTIIYNNKTNTVESSFVSLCGTIRNCAGGVTPWGSWLSCEESVEKPNGEIGKNHGFVFEVPSTARTMTEALPVKAMGRFNHEAAVVDPSTGIVYMTEDRGDGLLYRFIPNEYGVLHSGGKLQALAIKGKPRFDSRNWHTQPCVFKNGKTQCG